MSISKYRKFVIKNYYGIKSIPFKFNGKELKATFFRAAPKIFATFLVYGILKVIQTIDAGMTSIVWWDIPFLLAIIVQFSWSTPFYGISYYDKHPLTEEEKLIFPTDPKNDEGNY